MALTDNDEGVLGCLIGVIVLVFAGIGFTIAADKLRNHRITAADTAPDIREFEEELIALTAKERILRLHLEETQATHRQTRAKLSRVSVRTNDSVRKIQELQGEKRRLEADIPVLESEIQETVRNLVTRARVQAMRQTISVLKLHNGSVYRDVRITVIKDGRIRIQHAEGSANIAADLLEPRLRAELGLNSIEPSP